MRGTNRQNTLLSNIELAIWSKIRVLWNRKHIFCQVEKLVWSCYDNNKKFKWFPFLLMLIANILWENFINSFTISSMFESNTWHYFGLFSIKKIVVLVSVQTLGPYSLNYKKATGNDTIQYFTFLFTYYLRFLSIRPIWSFRECL